MCHPVDEKSLEQQRHDQLSRLAEMRDQCDLLTGVVQQKQQATDRLFAFMLDNSLRMFIPATKTFNGRTYQDYENEYVTHHNIVEAANVAASSGGDATK